MKKKSLRTQQHDILMRARVNNPVDLPPVEFNAYMALEAQLRARVARMTAAARQPERLAKARAVKADRMVERQRRILALVAAGWRYRAIARHIGCSLSTVWRCRKVFPAPSDLPRCAHCGQPLPGGPNELPAS